MAENRTNWLRYLPGAAIAIVAGWIVARGQFSSDSRVQLCVVIALGGGILAANFPWTKLQRGTAHEKDAARRALFAVSVGLLMVAGIGYEILVRRRGDWFVNYAPLALVMAGLGLLLKKWVAGKSSSRGHRND